MVIKDDLRKFLSFMGYVFLKIDFNNLARLNKIDCYFSTKSLHTFPAYEDTKTPTQ